MALFPEDDAPRDEQSGSAARPGSQSRAGRTSSDPVRGGSPGPAPLAERMRPQALDEFLGQEHLLGPQGPLGPIAEGRARLHSLLLWGPPGSGKTTLARLLAVRTGLRFTTLSAVQSGVKELRGALELAEHQKRLGHGTALFVDEIHRFNKAQQDALLPAVERGDVVLLGATTENPSFEVISALRSRCAIYVLQPHDGPALERLVERALRDPERGLGRSEPLDRDGAALLIQAAQGDARRALQVLERAAERCPGAIDTAAIRAALETPLPDYDKAGDAHYDVISAFIKSLRGSAPDAALYWLVRMLEAGEDPRFICRRMLIFASEDIGNADPHALVLAASAAQAFDHVGLPEARLILAQATLYLACAPKSNASTRALAAAEQAVREGTRAPVPLHLRNAPTSLMRAQGHGQGYRNPHAFPGHFVRAAYLPEALAGSRFYEPTDQGAEAALAARLNELWAPHSEGDG